MESVCKEGKVQSEMDSGPEKGAGKGAGWDDVWGDGDAMRSVCLVGMGLALDSSPNRDTSPGRELLLE